MGAGVAPRAGCRPLNFGSLCVAGVWRGGNFGNSRAGRWTHHEPPRFRAFFVGHRNGRDAGFFRRNSCSSDGAVLAPIPASVTWGERLILSTALASGGGESDPSEMD